MKLKPSVREVAELKAHYRKLAEEHANPMVQRIAQGMETALIWATETNDWENIASMPVLLAKCLADDLKAPHQ